MIALTIIKSIKLGIVDSFVKCACPIIKNQVLIQRTSDAHPRGGGKQGGELYGLLSITCFPWQKKFNACGELGIYPLINF
jgi:hypothetical protein